MVSSGLGGYPVMFWYLKTGRLMELHVLCPQYFSCLVLHRNLLKLTCFIPSYPLLPFPHTRRQQKCEHPNRTGIYLLNSLSAIKVFSLDSCITATLSSHWTSVLKAQGTSSYSGFEVWRRRASTDKIIYFLEHKLI